MKDHLVRMKNMVTEFILLIKELNLKDFLIRGLQKMIRVELYTIMEMNIQEK